MQRKDYCDVKSAKARDGPVRAVVADVIREGDAEPYAVAYAEGIDDSITFSLVKPTWKEENRWPVKGNEVILDDIRWFKGKLRAYKARFARLSDGKRKRVTSRE